MEYYQLDDDDIVGMELKDAQDMYPLFKFVVAVEDGQINSYNTAIDLSKILVETQDGIIIRKLS